jgi:hypothetical protein
MGTFVPVAKVHALIEAVILHPSIFARFLERECAAGTVLGPGQKPHRSPRNVLAGIRKQAPSMILMVATFALAQRAPAWHDGSNGIASPTARALQTPRKTKPVSFIPF